MFTSARVLACCDLRNDIRTVYILAADIAFESFANIGSRELSVHKPSPRLILLRNETASLIDDTWLIEGWSVSRLGVDYCLL